ncbi:heme-based aerotactic transducer HemAT [Lysinibacillus sp. PLM2]|nr:heme-based aerotactic transducer HemAT [Lysinibacillus sp. PLM2]
MIRLFNKTNQSNLIELKTEQFINNVQLDVGKYPNLTKQLQLIQLTKEDLAILKQLEPLSNEFIPMMVNEFYSALTLSDHLINIINEHSKIERLKVTLTKHLKDIFKGQINREYIEERNAIAHTHVRIGLESNWYIGSFQSLMTTFIYFINDLQLSKDDTARAINAFSKIINFEQQLVIQAYDLEQQRIREQNEKVKMSLISTIQNTAEELNAISEETTASLQLITAQSENISTATKQGLSFVAETEEKSSLGTQHLEKQTQLMNIIIESVDILESSMHKLSDSSKKITEIVGLVTGIADQTNLLALNASIEAARAGEHGKGFAVVAEEVRKLAEETKNAVQNVSTLIKETENNITNMTGAVTHVDKQVHLSVEAQQRLAESFKSIAQSVSGIKDQYSNTTKDINEISNHLAELADSATFVSSSSDSLVSVLHDLTD